MAADPDMHILLVDDFSTMRRIIKNLLKDIGFINIDEAEHGQAGLAKLKSDKFDFIISDWNMPVMTGIEFLRAVRSDSDLKETPFLMVTAEAKQQNVVEALQAGVNNYVVKPFTSATLKDKIDKIFGP